LSQGEQEVENDESIADDAIIYRRLPPDQLPDREDGPGKRAATNAFNDRRDPDGVSAWIHRFGFWGWAAERLMVSAERCECVMWW